MRDDIQYGQIELLIYKFKNEIDGPLCLSKDFYISIILKQFSFAQTSYKYSCRDKY